MYIVDILLVMYVLNTVTYEQFKLIKLMQTNCRGAVLASDDDNSSATSYTDITDLSAGPVVFRYDNKLQLPSYSYFTEEQVIPLC